MVWQFAVDVIKPITIQENLVLDSACQPLVALVGPNGAGKSTLLRALAGFLGPHQGGARGTPWQRPVTWVSQQPTLFPHRTVRQQVEWVLRESLKSNDELMTWVGILDAGEFLDARPGALSGGQQQRAMILRALAGRQQVLALDEALSQIDPASRESIASRLREWAEEEPERLLIMATHQFSHVAHLADRVLVMMGGKIVRDGTPFEVVRKPGSWEVAALVGYVARMSVEGVDYALKADSVKWEPPGLLVSARVAQLRDEDAVARLETQAGRSYFILDNPNPDLRSGSIVNVYIQGVALNEKEALKPYASSLI